MCTLGITKKRLLLLKYNNRSEIKEMFVNYNLYVSEKSVMTAL